MPCLSVEHSKKNLKYRQDSIYCVGDEVDQYWGSMFDKDPDALHTPNSELYECQRRLTGWYRAFPQMKLAISNHGLRWAKKAFKAGIPSQMLIPYQKLISAPRGWVWREDWEIRFRHKMVYMIHGLGYGGMYAYRHAALDNGCNTVFGHLHANAGIARIKTKRQDIWGMNVGCLINVPAYAFHYGKDARFKPWLGAGVVLDGGRTPLLIPYERFRDV